MALIDDIAQHLHNQGIGVMGSTLRKAYLPSAVDNGILVSDTGGMEPDRDLLEIKDPTFQIFIRWTDYSGGRAKLDAVRAALHGISGQRLIPNGLYFYSIFALSEGGHLGRDEKQRDLFSINFHCRLRD